MLVRALPFLVAAPLLLAGCFIDADDTGGDGRGGEGRGGDGVGGTGVGGEGEGEAGGDEGEGEAVGDEGEGEAGGGGEGEGEGVVVGDITVLLIGNSQLGFFGGNPQPPDVSRSLEELSTVVHDGAARLIVDRAQIAGTGCDGFLFEDGPESPKERAGSGDYDIVILLPAIFEREASVPCWNIFKNTAEAAGSEFGVMATANVSDQYPGGFDALDRVIRDYAVDNDLLFVPGGDAWRRVLGDNPGNARFEMYGGDDAHPGAEGSYFYVLALYGAITGRSVVGFPPDVAPLRCMPDQSCLTYADLDACVDDEGLFHCSAQNGALFDGNGAATFITAAEASLYQQAVDDALNER